MGMNLTFMGADRQVTGSRYCLDVGKQRVMIDCGLDQEREFLERNWEACPVPAETFGSLLLTHAHLDHVGLIPRLVAEGFNGPIYATRATVDLAEIILRDSAHIQEEDAAYKLKRHRREGRKGRHPEVPLYTMADVERTLPAFVGVDYNRPLPVGEGIEVTFRDAGHILGSAMLEVHVSEQEIRRRIVFSGDIGQSGKPLIGDPCNFDQADYVVMESTYGDRDHEAAGDIETQLELIIQATLKRGGRVVIPTFAVERAQELMFYIGRLVYANRIPDVPIFLDSAMAVDVTEIFRKHREYLDAESRELIMSREPPLRYPGLRLIRTTEESKSLNEIQGPCIVMSAAGMCNAGRIKHHLRNNIEHSMNTILFVGYQAHGTLGRQILEGNPEVRIHGRMYTVRAQIAHISGLSGHADRKGLLKWLGHFKTPPRRLFLTHGEASAAEHLAEQIRTEMNWRVTIPDYRDEVALL
jgi:metallo-beta-lactamase family protein